jgi:hypothetical protein
MALTLGTRLGPYEILALLGADGMGEVRRCTKDPLNGIIEPQGGRLNGMEYVNDVVRFFVLASATAILYFNRHAIKDAIERFRDNFPRGGGPGTPMHPSPVGDGALLRRKSSPKLKS